MWELILIIGVIIILLFIILGKITKKGKLYYVLDYVFLSLVMITGFIVACNIIKMFIDLWEYLR